jgi:hypothetical protein
MYYRQQQYYTAMQCIIDSSNNRQQYIILVSPDPLVEGASFRIEPHGAELESHVYI